MITVDFDKQLFLIINSLVGKIPLLDNLVKLIVNEYFIPVALALIILYLWVSKKGKKSMALPVFSVGLVDLVIKISNRFIVRARPFDETAVKLLFYKPTDPSFPANSAAVGFALATSIFLINKKWGIFALILAAFYGFSRIYVGVHFPSDVLVGSFLGIVLVLFVARLIQLVNLVTNWVENIQTKIKLDL